MIIKLVDSFTRKQVMEDSDFMYLFTDNLNRSSGTNPGDKNSHYARVWCLNTYCNYFYPNQSQAVIRGLPNAFPITTMKNQFKTQLDDEIDFETMSQVWNLEFNDIIDNLDKYKGLKLSKYQIGNGTYSRLIDQPKLFSCLCMHLADLGIDNSHKFIKLIN